MSCAAALAVLDTIADEHLLDNVKRVGEHLADALDAIDSPLVAGTRGSGLWRALVLTDAKAGAVEAAARERGLLVNAVKPDVDPARPAADPHRGRRRRRPSRCSPPRSTRSTR